MLWKIAAFQEVSMLKIYLGDIYASISTLVKELYGEDVSVTRMDSVAGGDINLAYRVRLSCGTDIFVKTNSLSNEDFFAAEAKGLAALSSVNEIGVPEILGRGSDQEKGYSFLALEYIESSPRISSYWETFGHELAMLHRAKTAAFTVAGENSAGRDGVYGFSEDNYIGASPQKNRPMEKWTDFYRERRLMPQLSMAERYLSPEIRKKADRLLGHLEDYMREPKFPSLLHGDLWSGNMICGPDGKAWIIDPAVYVGDFEADLAMTQLFGSLPERFYDAYSEVNPIDRKGYRERKGLYDLYHMLNHLNLFGRAYLGSVVSIIRQYT